MALDDFDTHENAESQAAKPIHKPAPTSATAFVPAPAKKPANPEDEDLFDFPVAEMKFEADVAAKPTAAPAPATAPAQAKPEPKPAAAASAAPVPAKPAPAKPTPPAAAGEKKDVAKAAQLVEDIEHVLGADGKQGKRARKLQGPSPLTLVGIAALVLTNVFGLLFLWRTSQSFQSSVQAMNQQLEASRRQSMAQTQPAPAPPRSSESGPSVSHAPVPLEASELSTLQMAREEIQDGEYAAARRRLSRLLATADRLDSESRESIEAQASFLLAHTYRKQAEAAREKSP